MPEIRSSEVIIGTRFVVDCTRCQQGVETEEGPFRTREEALDAKRRHLNEHAQAAGPLRYSN